MNDEGKIELYAELLLEDYMDFAEQCGVTVAIKSEDIQEVLEQFDPEQLEVFMDDPFARGFLMGSMIETTPATDGDYDKDKKATTH